MRQVLAIAVVCFGAVVAACAQAATITHTLGDNDFRPDAGISLSLFSGRRAGDPPPFNVFSGSDRGSRGFVTFTHVVPVLEYEEDGVLELAIFDHDSFMPGQDTLDISFDGVQQDTSMWEGISMSGRASIHTRSMPVAPEFFLDGILDVVIEGRSFAGHGQTSNGLGVDFSSLTVTIVPLPASGLFLLCAVLGLGIHGRRKPRA